MTCMRRMDSEQQTKNCFLLKTEAISNPTRPAVIDKNCDPTRGRVT